MQLLPSCFKVALACAAVTGCAGSSDDAPGALANDASTADAGGDVSAADGFALDSSAPNIENWLLAVSNQPKHELLQISVLPGSFGAIHKVVCPDLHFSDEGAGSDVVSSLTFFNGVLYAVGAAEGAATDFNKRSAALYRVNPCTCNATRVGAFGSGLGLVGGITSYGNKAVYGISSTNNTFFSVDLTTGAGTAVKVLPVKWGASGLSWSDTPRDTLWGIESDSDSLYELNAKGDFVTAPIKLDYDFAGLGMEYHTGLKKLFACSKGHILEVNTTDGKVTEGPAFERDFGCANLAAPFGSVECIDNIR